MFRILRDLRTCRRPPGCFLCLKFTTFNFKFGYVSTKSDVSKDLFANVFDNFFSK